MEADSCSPLLPSSDPVLSDWFLLMKSGSIEDFVAMESKFSSSLYLKDEEGYSLLHSAALAGNIEAIKYIDSLNEIESLYKTWNFKNETPLLLAAKSGHLPVVQWFLNKGNSIKELDIEECSCILLAARGGHLETVKYLHEFGCSLIEERDKSGKNCLLLASQGGHIDIVKWLFNQGSSLQEKDSSGMTSLLLAAAGGHLHTLQWLIEKGSSIEEKDRYGFTSFILASGGGYFDISMYLIEHGCSIPPKEDLETYFLFHAAGLGHLEMVRWLIEYGCSVNETKDDGENSALGLAVEKNCVEVVRTLLYAGAVSDEVLNHLESLPSFEVLEILVNDGELSLENIKLKCGEKHFSAFMNEMNRKKTNKRAAH